MRLMTKGYTYSQFTPPVTPPPGGGPWADPFDDPTGPVAYSRWVNGSTSGNSVVNSTMWSSWDGIGSGDAVRWWMNGTSGRDEVGTKTYDDFDPHKQMMVMRFRVKFITTPPGKLYLYPEFRFMDGFAMHLDITPDATPSGARALAPSANLTNAWFEQHPTNGVWYFKANVDMSAASDVNGQIFWWLSDQDENGDGLYDQANAFDMHVQDLTFELV